MLSEHAVVFLRHSAIKGAMAGLEVSERDAGISCSDRRHQGRVCVALCDFAVRRKPHEPTFWALEHEPGLLPVAARPHLEVGFDRRNAGRAMGTVAHERVVVVLGTDD